VNPLKFDAFISYRHSELDKTIAEKLHKMLETYRIPGPVAKRYGKKKLGRVFRDREELPTSSNLAENIEQALKSSEYLIVICSPRTPHSQWVRKEIETFAELHGHDRILALLIEGEHQESFPEPLRFARKKVVGADGQVSEVLVEVEPLAADIRGQNLGAMKKTLKTEILRLLAPIIGCGFDDLKQRHKERMIKRVATVSLSLALFFLAFGSFSTYQALLIKQKSEEIAQKSEQLKQQVDKTLRGQSLFLASKSEELLKRGDRMLAVLAAKEALPKNWEELDRPYVEEAEYALSEALYVYRPQQSMTVDVVVNHKHPVKYMALSPGGKTLVTITYNADLFVWDAENGQLLYQYKDLDNPIHVDKAFFVDDETLIISTYESIQCLEVPSFDIKWECDEFFTDFALSEDKTSIIAVKDALYILDAGTGEILKTLSVNKTEDGPFLLSSLTVSSFDRYAVAYREGDIYAFDLYKGQFLGIHRAKHEGIACLAVSNDGVLGVISKGEGGSACALDFIDISSGRNLYSQDSEDLSIKDLRAHSYQEDYFFYISEKALQVVSISQGQVIATFNHDTFINDYNISPILLTVAADGVLRYWDLERPDSMVHSMTFSDAPALVSWTEDKILLASSNKASILKYVKNENLAALEGHDGAVNLAGYSSDGKRLFSHTYDRLILWDVEHQKQLASVMCEASIQFAAFVDKDQKLFTVSEDGMLSLYDATNLNLIDQYSLDDSIMLVIPSADKSLCYVKGIWGEDKIFRTSDLSLVADLSEDMPSDLAFFPDNRRVAIRDYSSIRIIDLEKGQVTKEVPADALSMKLSHNGKYLACLYYDNTVGIFDTQSLDEILRFLSVDITVKDIFFDAKDETLFMASEGYTLRRYSIKNGKLLSDAETKGIAVEKILFSPDNKYYITVGDIDDALIWSNDSNKALGRIDGFLSVSPDFGHIIVNDYENVCIMPFYTTQKLIEEADRQLKGRTLTEQEKKQLFIVD